MQVSSIKTDKLSPGGQTILEVLDKALPRLAAGTVVAITSKIISICEGRVIPIDQIDKDDLVRQEAKLYLPRNVSKYGQQFTITGHTLIPVAGIDESNGDGHYVLWPSDAQASANDIYDYLADKHGTRKIGVLITDSTSQPLRRGTIGVALAHSGFRALKDYIGQPDLFGRPIAVSKANLSGGLAAAAVLAMGEGSEQTPICVLTSIPLIEFQGRHPDQQELAEINLTIEDDLFEPFLAAVDWQRSS